MIDCLKIIQYIFMTPCFQFVRNRGVRRNDEQFVKPASGFLFSRNKTTSGRPPLSQSDDKIRRRPGAKRIQHCPAFRPPVRTVSASALDSCGTVQGKKIFIGINARAIVMPSRSDGLPPASNGLKGVFPPGATCPRRKYGPRRAPCPVRSGAGCLPSVQNTANLPCCSVYETLHFF